VIALTHVCRAWRGVFTSRPSLWTYFDFHRMTENKVRTYLERSKSSPISLSLYGYDSMYPSDLFFHVIPNSVGRLKHLSIEVLPENLHQITAHLTPPAPLLEDLSVCGNCQYQSHHPVSISELFDGDLSSLRRLHLDSVYTKLPWRNMANLTSFTLDRMPPGVISVTHLLDFFESAPHLHQVYLHSVTLASSTQGGRLVSLMCLKKMEIEDGGLPSALLDHLLIPFGADLTIKVDVLGPLIGDLLPRSLDNLRNLSNFTTIKLSIWAALQSMIFSGPNGRAFICPQACQVDKTCLMLESLAQLDTSETERFRIQGADPPSRDPLYRALLPMNSLRALRLSECHNLHIFIHALHPGTSSSEVMVCPKLEELALVLRGDQTEVFYMKNLIEMAEARASRGKKLKIIKIVYKWIDSDPEDVLELRKHVEHVEYDPRVDTVDDW